MNGRRNEISLVSLWIWLCALLNAAGWILSALHALHRTGYLVAFGLIALAGFAWRDELGLAQGLHFDCHKQRRRFARKLPAGFLILAALACLGGIVHAPSNYDALAYRIPRVLHWLAEERWHWIHTGFERLNTRGCGMEWVSAPWLAFTGSDRWLFLPNAISFLLLPGLIFGALRGLGVRGRVAYAWMWVLPSGYCFVLQAGSVGNDLFTVPFVLAAVQFGLRARRTGERRWLWLSLLACALFTGAKANTLPLVLVVAVVAAPCWRLLLQKPLQTACLFAICLACSFFPTAFQNWRHTGDWTGAKAERLSFATGAPWARLAGNLGLVAVENLMPPIAPQAGWWNAHVAAQAIPASLQENFRAAFPQPSSILEIGELQVEESAGLGFGVCLLLFAWWVAILRAKRCAQVEATQGSGWFHGFHWVFTLAMLVAVAALLKTSFVKSTARLLTPYYLLMIVPLLLHPAHQRIERRRWWTRLAVAMMALAALLLAVNPGRPLLPVQQITRSLRQTGFFAELCARAERVYSVYGERGNAFAPARKLLPADVQVFGLVTYDDPEASLWQPYRSCRVLHVTHDDDRQKLSSLGIQFILTCPSRHEAILQMPFELWLAGLNADVVGETTLTLRAGVGPTKWCLVKLRSSAPP
jgi:hypothetical protein